MKKMTINSKRAQNWLEAYNASNYRNVSHAYTNPSINKLKADLRCQELCYMQENGCGYRIILANTFNFTVAWKTPEGNLRVETAHNSYLIEI